MTLSSQVIRLPTASSLHRGQAGHKCFLQQKDYLLLCSLTDSIWNCQLMGITVLSDGCWFYLSVQLPEKPVKKMELTRDSWTLMAGRGLSLAIARKEQPIDVSWHSASMQMCQLLYFCNTDILEGKFRLNKHPDYIQFPLLATPPKESLTAQ